MFQNEQIDLSMQQPSPILKKIMPDVFEPAPRIGFNSFWFNVSAAQLMTQWCAKHLFWQLIQGDIQSCIPEITV